MKKIAANRNYRLMKGASSISLFNPPSVLDVAHGWKYLVSFLNPGQFAKFKNNLNNKMGEAQNLDKLAELELILKAMHGRGQLKAIWERAGEGDAGVIEIVDAAINQLQYI